MHVGISDAEDEPMNRLLSLHHVGIVVRDIEASASWYERHLGFERVYGYAFPGAQVMFIARGMLSWNCYRPRRRRRWRPSGNERKRT